jgi:hypothetical protein
MGSGLLQRLTRQLNLIGPQIDRVQVGRAWLDQSYPGKTILEDGAAIKMLGLTWRPAVPQSERTSSSASSFGG